MTKENKEIEIASFHTGMAIGDGFFESNDGKREVDYLPAVTELFRKCEGVIKEPGLYAIRLQIVKLK